MQDLYRDYLTAEKDIKTILGAQLMASTPQDYAVMEGVIKGILCDWDARGESGIPFFVHVMASKCEQFYMTVANSLDRAPLDLFKDDGQNGFTPEGLKEDGYGE